MLIRQECPEVQLYERHPSLTSAMVYRELTMLLGVVEHFIADGFEDGNPWTTQSTVNCLIVPDGIVPEE